MKFLSLILCFCFLIKDAHATSPRIVQISPHEMEKLQENPEVETKEVLILNQDTRTHEQKVEHENRKRADPLDVFTGFHPSSGEEVLIVFAIVGVVLVIAWIASLPVAVYKAASDKDPKFQHLLSANYSNFNLQENQGSLAGMKYGFYLGENVGITSEIGQYDFDDQGAYWMIGPSMIYHLEEEILFKLDLGAGSSFDSNFGLMSKADLSVNYLFKSGFNLGVGISGMYLQIKEFDGVSRSNQDIGLGWALNTGYLF